MTPPPGQPNYDPALLSFVHWRPGFLWGEAVWGESVWGPDAAVGPIGGEFTSLTIDRPCVVEQGLFVHAEPAVATLTTTDPAHMALRGQRLQILYDGEELFYGTVAGASMVEAVEAGAAHKRGNTPVRTHRVTLRLQQGTEVLATSPTPPRTFTTQQMSTRLQSLLGTTTTGVEVISDEDVDSRVTENVGQWISVRQKVLPTDDKGTLLDTTRDMLGRINRVLRPYFGLGYVEIDSISRCAVGSAIAGTLRFTDSPTLYGVPHMSYTERQVSEDPQLFPTGVAVKIAGVTYGPYDCASQQRVAEVDLGTMDYTGRDPQTARNFAATLPLRKTPRAYTSKIVAPAQPDLFTPSFPVPRLAVLHRDGADEPAAIIGVTHTITPRGWLTDFDCGPPHLLTRESDLDPSPVGGYSVTQEIPLGAYFSGASYGTSGWTATQAEWQQITGVPLAAARHYAGTTYTIDTTLSEIMSAGLRICLSFSPPYNPVSSADRTSIGNMLAAMKAAGADVKVALWHEPALSGLTAAQYVAAVQYYGPTIRQYYPLWCVFNGTDAIEANGYFPGAAYVDGIAADDYVGGTDQLGNCQAMADAYGLPLGLWEFNTAFDLGMDPSPVSGVTHADGTAFFNSVRDLFLARIAAGKPCGDVLFFSATGPTATTGTRNFLGSSRSQAGGFEGGIANWVARANCTIAGSTAFAKSGSGSLALTATAAGTMSAAHCTVGNIATQGMPITAGQTAGFSGWMRPGSTARSFNIGVAFYDAVGTLLVTVVASGSEIAGTFNNFAAGTAIAPASTAFARVFGEVVSPAAGEVHYLDDPQVCVLPPSTDHTAPIQYPWDYRIGLLTSMRAALQQVVVRYSSPKSMPTDVPIYRSIFWATAGSGGGGDVSSDTTHTVLRHVLHNPTSEPAGTFVTERFPGIATGLKFFYVQYTSDPNPASGVFSDTYRQGQPRTAALTVT